MIPGYLIFWLPILGRTRKKYLEILYVPTESYPPFFRSFKRYVLDHLMIRDTKKWRTLITGGVAGEKWSDCYFSRMGDYNKSHYLVLDSVSEEIRNRNAKRVCQVGCAGGGELALLSTTFPSVKLTGIDLNRGAIENNRRRHPRSIQFLSADVTEYPFPSEAGTPDLVFFSGCAEYLTEAELIRLLESFSAMPVDSILFCEPITYGAFDPETTFRSMPRGGGGAFSHNYRHLLQKSGYAISKDLLVRDPSNPVVADWLIVGSLRRPSAS